MLTLISRLPARTICCFATGLVATFLQVISTAQDRPTQGPQVTGPQVTGPQVTGPQVTGPQVTGPQVTGPQVTGQQVTGQQVTGQRAGQSDKDNQVDLEPAIRQRCLSVLRSVFQGAEFWPAMHAAEGLTLAGSGNEVVASLRTRLETESDHQRKCGLSREIVRAGDRRPLAVLRSILADPNSNGRVHAAESLFKIAEIGDGRQLSDSLRQTQDVRLRIMAGAALARTGNLHALDIIRTELNSDDVEIRKVAAWVLGFLGTASDVPSLQKVWTQETDAVAKAYATNALALLGDRDARQSLADSLRADDPTLRVYAAEFAGYCRAVDVQARLVEMLDDPNVDVRARAAQSLIVLSSSDHVLGLPYISNSEPFRVDAYPADDRHPRLSEGSVIELVDGSILYATTQFKGDSADHATAKIVGRTSSDGGRTWGPIRTLQDNIGTQNVMSVTLRRLPPGGDTDPLAMFFLQKNSATDLRVMLRVSIDQGASFGEPMVVTKLPGYHVLNNDRITILRSGRILCPTAWTADVSQGGHFVCRTFISDDQGKTWHTSKTEIDLPKRGAMEPEIVELADGRLLMIVRTQLGHIATCYSADSGEQWSIPTQFSLAAPESPATIRRIPSTGDLLLVWNNTFRAGSGHGGKRTPLTSAISRDGGGTWEHVRNLEDSPNQAYAYTSVLFYKDRALLTYYVDDDATRRLSSRFLSIPVRWFYGSK